MKLLHSPETASRRDLVPFPQLESGSLWAWEQGEQLMLQSASEGLEDSGSSRISLETEVNQLS